jgi:hypothetical protein
MGEIAVPRHESLPRRVIIGSDLVPYPVCAPHLVQCVTSSFPDFLVKIAFNAASDCNFRGRYRLVLHK